MGLSKRFKMRTAFICFVVITFTLSGNSIFKVEPKLSKDKKEIDHAQEILMSVESRNIQLLQQIEQQLHKYELRTKNLEYDSLQ